MLSESNPTATSWFGTGAINFYLPSSRNNVGLLILSVEYRSRDKKLCRKNLFPFSCLLIKYKEHQVIRSTRVRCFFFFFFKFKLILNHVRYKLETSLNFLNSSVVFYNQRYLPSVVTSSIISFTQDV